MTTNNRHGRRALVIGGSISGLFAALMLERHGWNVDVLERSMTELAGRGAGIVAQPELRAALSAAGIGDIGEVGVTVEERILLDRDGRQTMRYRCPQTVTSWERVRGLLRARLAGELYHPGAEMTRIDQVGGHAVVHLADGTTREADLVIGADGIRSTVRQQLFPDIQPEYAGYVAWRSLIDEKAFSRATHERLFWKFAFCLPPGEQIIGYPVTGPHDDMTPGNLRYNLVWYRPADEATELPNLLTDASGKTHALSIPPPLIRPDVRSALEKSARQLLPPEFQECVALSPQAFIQPIYDVASTRVASGRVAIIGDAAFIARPHVAAGVIKAADDVVALVDGLDRVPDIETALLAYEASRVPVGRRIVGRARAMGASYRARQAGEPPGPSGSDADYARSVVEDTALLDFLRQPAA